MLTTKTMALRQLSLSTAKDQFSADTIVAQCTQKEKRMKQNVFTFTTKPIGHFTVVCLVTWPLSGSEAGGDLALIQTLLLFTCKSFLFSC